MTTATAEHAGFTSGSHLRRVAATPVRGDAWRAYLYLVLVTLLAAPSVTFVFVAALGTGLLIVTLVGIPLLAAVVLSGRAWGRLYRSLTPMAGVVVDEPMPLIRPAGAWALVRPGLTDAVGLRALAFLTLQALAAVVGFNVLMGVVMAAVLVGAPVLWLATGEAVVTLGAPVDSLGSYLGLALAGVVALYLLGWVMLGCTRVHAQLVRALLGPTTRERRVAELQRTRSAVVEDSVATLRRVERDLHDGTQARLITVAMALVRAEEHLAGDTQHPVARDLVSEALANTKDALTELRDLVRGLRPPALDLGLDAAVQTLAARNPLPATLVSDMAVRPSMGVETMAYFCVAELLANVTRHPGATQVSVQIYSDAASLQIVVHDDGCGGAQVGAGSGLSGLRDRLAAVDGQLNVESPEGGPTTVTVVVPNRPAS